MGTATVQPASEGAGNLFRRTLDHWRRAAHALGVVQTRFIMFALYVVLVMPLGFLFRLSRDPLHLRRREGTNWVPCRDEKQTLERAQQQF